MPMPKMPMLSMPMLPMPSLLLLLLLLPRNLSSFSLPSLHPTLHPPLHPTPTVLSCTYSSPDPTLILPPPNNPLTAPPTPFAQPGVTSALKNATDLPISPSKTLAQYLSTPISAPSRLSPAEIYKLTTLAHHALLTSDLTTARETYEHLHSCAPGLYLYPYGVALYYGKEYGKGESGEAA